MSVEQIQESLKAKFRQSEIALAGAIGADSIELKDKIGRLFAELPDPLLSNKEVQLLLQVNADFEEMEKCLDALVKDDVLEKSVTTQRALDKEGVGLYRIKHKTLQRLKLLGVASRLSDESVRFQFTIDGRLIRAFAAVDRLDAIAGTGNQRDEIIKHVREISDGMRSGVQVPNSVIVVFNEQVFSWDQENDEAIPESWVICRVLGGWVNVPHPDDSTRTIQEVASVELDIPYRNAAFDEEKCALLVDGQQRTAALSLVDVDVAPSYQLSVNALVSTHEEAKSTFRIANTTVKITTDFSRALLGTLDDAPGYVKQEKRVAQAVKILALDDAFSPFYKLVKHPGVESRGCPIAYNTLFAVVNAFDQSSLEFNEKPEELATCVRAAFDVVKKVWPEAWGKAPKDSRLMHGAGLRAITGVLVDLVKSQAYINNYDWRPESAWTEIHASLERLATRVQWTAAAISGTATQKKIYMDEIQKRQNTNQDIQALTQFLQKEVTHLDKKAKEPKK